MKKSTYVKRIRNKKGLIVQSGSAQITSSLTVAGAVQLINKTTAAPLRLDSGDSNSGANSYTQIAFGYNGTDQFQNFITSKHNSSTALSNSIDFYTSDGTQFSAYPTNAIHGISVANGKLGVNRKYPTNTLDVAGDVVCNNITTSVLISASRVTASAYAGTFVSATALSASAISSSTYTGTLFNAVTLSASVITASFYNSFAHPIRNTWTPVVGAANSITLSFATPEMYLTFSEAKAYKITSSATPMPGANQFSDCRLFVLSSAPASCSITWGASWKNLSGGWPTGSGPNKSFMLSLTAYGPTTITGRLNFEP